MIVKIKNQIHKMNGKTHLTGFLRYDLPKPISHELVVDGNIDFANSKFEGVIINDIFGQMLVIIARQHLQKFKQPIPKQIINWILSYVYPKSYL